MHWVTSMFGGPQRVNHAAVAIKNKIYSFGGYSSEEAYEIRINIDMHVLDADTLRWRPVHYSNLKEAPKKCYGHTVVAYGLKAYLWGGRSNLCANNQLYCFDSVSLAWYKIPITGTVPRKVDGHSACVIGDEMYVFGGYEGEAETFSNSVYCLNLKTFTWKKIATSGENPSSRDFHTASVIGNRMYIFGGRSGGENNMTVNDMYSNDIMYLDTTNFIWVKPSCTGKIPSGRRSHSAVVYNNEIYIIGGFDGKTRYHLNDIYKFNPETNHWAEMHPKGEPPSPRRRHCTVVVGDHLYLFGGSSPLDQEEYAKKYTSDAEDLTDYHLLLKDHCDTVILDFFPSLKRLCQLKILKNKLSIIGAPQTIIQEMNMLEVFKNLSQAISPPHPHTDFVAVGFSA